MAREASAGSGGIKKALPRFQADPEQGLTEEQARQRLLYGYANENISPPTKTVGQIFKTNICTYFNLLFFIFAVFVVAVGAYTSLTFLPVVFANTFIGIVQELRSKRVLDKMSILASPRATVIRGGRRVSVPTDETVLDDISVFAGGEQIYADAIVVSGQCRVNESLITGESDEIVKNPGDSLTSGSFVVSGECAARLDKVGRECFVSRLTLEAKKGKFAGRGEMMDSLQKIVKVIGIIVIPLGIAMFLQQHLFLEQTIRDSVVSTVAALIGMIPEGLFLLASVALTVSIMRLARKKTLVHDMGCIESLACVWTRPAPSPKAKWSSRTWSPCVPTGSRRRTFTPSCAATAPLWAAKTTPCGRWRNSSATCRRGSPRTCSPLPPPTSSAAWNSPAAPIFSAPRR